MLYLGIFGSTWLQQKTQNMPNIETIMKAGVATFLNA